MRSLIPLHGLESDIGMGLFSRKKVSDEVASVESEAAEVANAEIPSIGPWDESDHPEQGALLDAGALWIPAVKGASIQFSVDQGRKVVLGVVFVFNQTAVQLQVFAAPKSVSLWEDVRAELISSIANQGGSSREHDGEYGPEIRAQMPAPGKAKTVQPVRYLGIDGPRWLLRVTVTGKGAVDEVAAASALHAVLDDLVVVRGQSPHPPREILPLSVPRTKAPEAEEPERMKLELPRRGPEIQEVR